MIPFQLQRLGTIIKPEPGDDLETEGLKITLFCRGMEILDTLPGIGQ